jgi:phosphoglucosamine mutase
LAQLVRESQADLGIAHDGDADRLLLCDERGNTLDGDEILAIAAIYLLRIGQLRDNTVVGTLMTNFGLDELMHQLGGKVLRAKVGDRHVIDSMVDHNLNLGGEQSGHIIFRDFTTTGDGLISALQILSVMVSSEKPLSELRRLLRKFPQVQRNVPVREKLPFEQFPLLMRRLANAEQELAGKGRVVLRYSGTELKARLLLEGPEGTHLDHLADAIEHALNQELGR